MPFGIGPPELLIILALGVLLFGKNLPSVGRSLGKSLMEFKKGLNDIKNEVNAATYDEPARPTEPGTDHQAHADRRESGGEVPGRGNVEPSQVSERQSADNDHHQREDEPA